MTSFQAFFYSSGQAAVHHAVLRPLRGNRQDPPPGIAQQPAVPPLQGPEMHREVEGVAEQAALPRHSVGQEGIHVNHMGNQGENRSEIRQRRPSRQRQGQQRGYVETLGNADNLYSGDEADTWQGSAAEDRDQHAEEELHTFSNEQMEENGASAVPAEKKCNPSAETDSKDNRTSGNTERNEVNLLVVLNPF